LLYKDFIIKYDIKNMMKKYYKKNPITSYGIICFKRTKNDINSSNMFSLLQEDKKTSIVNNYEFIIIRRKDTFSFAEFVKAKYDIYDETYIKKLLQNMTKHELTFLKNVKTPEEIWDKLWYKKGNNRIKEYEFKNKKKKIK